MKHFFHLTNILYRARTFDARRLISLKTVYKIIFTCLKLRMYVYRIHADSLLFH